MDFNIENDRCTDADIGWYAGNYAIYNAGETSGLLISRVVSA